MRTALRSPSVSLVASLLGLALSGCPASGADRATDPAAQPCSTLGQACTFSPGKLGACVIKDGCDPSKEGCFVCQSQH
jgi:hypothetical protein